MRNAILALLAIPMLAFTGSAQSIHIQPAKSPAIIRLHDVETGSFFCSGTVISDQMVLTAGHCLQGEYKLGIEVKDQQGRSVGARVLAWRGHGRSDQGLLFGDFSMFEQMKVVTKPELILKLLKRNELTICGYPYSGPLFCESVQYKGIEIFQFKTDGAAWPGMSGGPVIDESTGYIIGIISAMSPDNVILSPTINIFYNLDIIEVQ